MGTHAQSILNFIPSVNHYFNCLFNVCDGWPHWSFKSWPYTMSLTNARCCLLITPKKEFLENGTLNFPILLWASLVIAFFRLLFHCCTHVLSMRCLISVHASSVRGNNKSQVRASINKMYWCPWAVNQSGVFGTCSQQWDTRCCRSVMEPAGKDSFLA